MRKPKHGGMVLSLTGGSEVGKMTTLQLLLQLILHSFFIKSETTRIYPEGDPRQELYKWVKEEKFSAWRILDLFALYIEHLNSINFPPARFGISIETINNVLLSEGTVGITVLNVEAAIKLRKYLGEEREMFHLPIYLCAPKETVHRRRLARKHLSKEEIDKQIEAAARMEKEARDSKVPFVFIASHPRARVVAGAIMKALKQHQRTHQI